MKTFKDLRTVQEQASPMIKPPTNEFGKKEDAFAHAKKHGGKVMKKTFTHPTSGMQTVSYVVREDAEQIDELKRTTLASYVSKAAGSYGRDKQNIGRESPDGTVAKARPELKRAVKNRLTGINRAAERLAKEEAEIDEASKKPNATTRHLRDYPVSDKDVAKPVKQSEYQHHVVSKLDGNVLASYKSREAAHRNAYGNPVVSGSLETIGDRKYVREQGVAEGTGKNVVKSVKVGNFRHDLVDTGMGWQVRIYNGDELYDTGMSKNSEQKGLAALEDAVAYTEKQTRTKRQGVSEGEGKTQKYEMMMRNGQVKKFIAKDDADAKRIAAGHGAKSVIRLKGDVPAGKISEEGVAEAAFKDPSPMMKDSIKQDRIRSLKNLIAVAKVKGVHHKVKEYELELKKLKETTEVTEAGAFSYGAKPPRKGSVAYNALMKRKEQDKNRVKEIEAIGTKNHHVGVAKVTKEDIEDVTEAKDTEMYKYIDQSGGQVIKGKSGTYVGYTHSATKGKGANILKHNATKKYYAAGGSSTAFTAKTTLHDTPQAAARAYHKGNLAESTETPEHHFEKSLEHYHQADKALKAGDREKHDYHVAMGDVHKAKVDQHLSKTDFKHSSHIHAMSSHLFKHQQKHREIQRNQEWEDEKNQTIQRGHEYMQRAGEKSNFEMRDGKLHRKKPKYDGNTGEKLREQDEKEAQEYDYEGDMARSDLRSIIFNAKEVHDMLEPNTNLPEWVQAKITKAEDYMSSVRSYMKAENEDL